MLLCVSCEATNSACVVSVALILTWRCSTCVCFAVIPAIARSQAVIQQAETEFGAAPIFGYFKGRTEYLMVSGSGQSRFVSLAIGNIDFVHQIPEFMSSILIATER